MHLPVLLHETVDLLAPEPGGVHLDCTAGLGGHAVSVARRLGPMGTLVLNDLDEGNLALAADAVREVHDPPHIETIHGPYDKASNRLEELGLHANTILADLGFASNQVDDAERGFAFSRDGPLDMRYDRSAAVSAADLVNTADEDELVRILRDFGEERHARRIARKLVAARESSPIRTTGQCAEIVRSAVGRRTERIDPATRTFQALRIAVNDELGSLTRFLSRLGRGWIAPGARLAVISFHSLEDRPVKHAFQALEKRGLAELLTRKPVSASDAEQDNNPRARSAKLRAVRIAG